VPSINIPELDIFGIGNTSDDTTTLEASLTQVFTPLSAVAFTVFVLLYTPCMATVAAMRQEFGARFMLYQITYTFAVAWLASVIVFQVGTLLSLGA
jgi:ferrous iron transport protein B